MLITPGKGITDGCGNPGCFMSYACGSCLVRHALLAIENGASTRMTEMVTDLSELNAKHIAEAYRQGDALGKKLIEQLIYYASLLIYNLFIAFNINCYVICSHSALHLPLSLFFLNNLLLIRSPPATPVSFCCVANWVYPEAPM